jgi:hypothetical protein
MGEKVENKKDNHEGDGNKKNKRTDMEGNGRKERKK